MYVLRGPLNGLSDDSLRNDVRTAQAEYAKRDLSLPAFRTGLTRQSSPRLTRQSSSAFSRGLMAQAPDNVVIGIDVGSTTVKMTVVDPTTKEIMWSKYLRHETRQPEMTREMLREIHAAFPTLKNDQIRCFITGSGG